MAFLNISLLAGIPFLAIPIVLHLIMRQKPKQQFFPALRFVKERRESNSRKLQLRHWILLALRCLAVALPAIALARPSVASAAWGNYLALGLVFLAFAIISALAIAAILRKSSRLLSAGLAGAAVLMGLVLLFLSARVVGGKESILGNQEAPVSAVLVIDTSPRMDYRHDNLRRLEAAQQMGRWLIEQLPADSEVAILDSRAGGGAFSVDRAAAGQAVDRLRTTGAPRALGEVVQAGLALAKTKPLSRKEVYVMSDLTAAAWQAGAPAELGRALEENKDVLLYIIDVGVDHPRNLALGGLKLSSQVLRPDGDLSLETEIRAAGLTGTRTVELILEEPDATLPIIRDGKPVFPKTQRRGVQTASVKDGDSQQLKFNLGGLRLGAQQQPTTYQGLIRILGEDGLPLDDVRHFAVEVQPDWPILIVSGPGVKPDYLRYAVEGNQQAKLRCELLPQAELPNRDLASESCRAICLLDPGPMPGETWEKLYDYASRGGGVALFLGHNAEPAKFQEPEPAKLLGGKLTLRTRSAGDLYLAPQAYDHPVLASFRTISDAVPWNRFPVNYHWNLDELAVTARLLIPYGNNKPALVANTVGRGRVLVMTTPITDPLRPRGRATWNELAFGDDAWPCLVLVNEMLLYLVGTGETRLNYHCGETAILPNDPALFPERYQIFTPLDEPQDLLARDGRVTVRFTENPGAYRLRGQTSGGPIVRGFAANYAATAGDLTRLPREKLDETLGKQRYQFARNREEINRAVGVERIGSEFYPLLFVLVALVLGLEQILSNVFYRQNE